MRCCKTDNICRLIVSILLRCLLVLLILTTIILSAVQIINLANDPNLTTFPTACPQYNDFSSSSGSPNQQNLLCTRVTKKDSFNADQLLKQDSVGGASPIIASYILQNGVNDFRKQVYNCLINKLQIKVTYNEDDLIVGSKADWILGLGQDFAVKIKKCEG